MLVVHNFQGHPMHELLYLHAHTHARAHTTPMQLRSLALISLDMPTTSQTYHWDLFKPPSTTLKQTIH